MRRTLASGLGVCLSGAAFSQRLRGFLTPRRRRRVRSQPVVARAAFRLAAGGVFGGCVPQGSRVRDPSRSLTSARTIHRALRPTKGFGGGAPSQAQLGTHRPGARRVFRRCRWVFPESEAKADSARLFIGLPPSHPPPRYVAILSSHPPSAHKVRAPPPVSPTGALSTESRIAAAVLGWVLSRSPTCRPVGRRPPERSKAQRRVKRNKMGRNI